MEDCYWSVKQAAEYSGLSRDTLYRFSRDRVIVSYKISRLVKFKKVDIDEWFKKCKRSQNNGRFN